MKIEVGRATSRPWRWMRSSTRPMNAARWWRCRRRDPSCGRARVAGRMRAAAGAAPGRTLPDRRSARHQCLRFACTLRTAHGGPGWHDGQRDEPALLANCYWKSLQLAESLGVQSIAFPAISCGVYGYPLYQAAQIAVTETLAWQRSHAQPMRIVLVAFNTATAKAYQQALSAAGQAPTANHAGRCCRPWVTRVLPPRIESRRSVEGKGRALPGLLSCTVDVIHAWRGSRSTTGSFHRSGVIGHGGCSVGSGTCSRCGSTLGAGPFHLHAHLDHACAIVQAGHVDGVMTGRQSLLQARVGTVATVVVGQLDIATDHAQHGIDLAGIASRRTSAGRSRVSRKRRRPSLSSMVYTLPDFGRAVPSRSTRFPGSSMRVATG